MNQIFEFCLTFLRPTKSIFRLLSKLHTYLTSPNFLRLFPTKKNRSKTTYNLILRHYLILLFFLIFFSLSSSLFSFCRGVNLSLPSESLLVLLTSNIIWLLQLDTEVAVPGLTLPVENVADFWRGWNCTVL